MTSTLYKIVVLGDGGVGKSCLTIQFTQNHFIREYDPTIENSYRKQITVDDEPCTLDILDTAGQDEYAVMRDQYINSGEGFILVYSIISRSSYSSMSEFRQKILEVKDVEEEYPMIMVGNKCDLDNERLVSTEEAKELAQKWKIQFFEASAKSRINVEESFKAVVRNIKKYKNRGATTSDQGNKKERKKEKAKQSPAKRKCILM